MLIRTSIRALLLLTRAHWYLMQLLKENECGDDSEVETSSSGYFEGDKLLNKQHPISLS